VLRPQNPEFRGVDSSICVEVVLQCVLRVSQCVVLQRVAVCCSVLQRVAACCSVLQCVAYSKFRVSGL